MRTSEVELTAPITLVCHDGTEVIENDRDDVMEITPEMTLAAARQIRAAEWEALKQSERFGALVRLVFPTIGLEPGRPIWKYGDGFKHVVGLIALTVQAIHAGKKPFWRTPEAFLHPRQQLGLADLVVELSRV